MLISPFSLKRIVSCVTLIAMSASQFAFIGLQSAYAAPTGTFVTSLITPNDPGLGVLSVTTFNINTPATLGQSLTIDNCTITAGVAVDSNCTDGNATYNGMTQTSRDAQATAIAGITFSNFTASKPGTDQFRLTRIGSAVAGNPDATGYGCVSRTINTVGVPPGPATSQVVEFIPTAPTIGETYSGSINSTTIAYTVTGSITIAQLVATLEPLLEADAATTCTEDGTKISCSANLAGTLFTYGATVVDITPPVIAQVTPVTTPTNDNTPNYTFSSTEAGTIGYAGGCTSATTLAVSGSNTITFNTLTDGTYSACTIQVTDIDGLNPSNILTLSPFTIDTAAPTIVLSTSAPNPTNGSFTVTATFSEPVTGFTGSEFVIGNGTASAFTVLSATGYTTLVTPTTDGTVTIDVAGSVAQDLIGNNNSAATQLAHTYDITPPTITISALPTSANSVTNSNLTFTLSEPSTNFGSGDIVVVGGTLSAFAGSGSVYTAAFIPTPSSTATGTINVAGSTFTDAAGNNNTPATQVDISVDTIVPTISITANPAVVNSGSTAEVTFTLSEPSINFVVGDITVTGGTISAFAGSGSVYTATFTPSLVTTTTGSIDVAAATFTDALGNPNTATQYVFAVDTLSPTPVLSSLLNPANGTFTVTATFPEPVTGVSITDFAVTNGSKNSFTAISPTVYTTKVTPSIANGAVTIDMAANTAIDLSNNPSLAASTLLIVNIDTVAPTASVIYSNTGITNLPVTVTLTGSSESITVTNNSGSTSYVLNSNGSFTFNFVDAAGNTGSTTATVTNIDLTPPTVSLTSTASLSVNDNFVVAIEFSKPVTGLTLGDFTLVNASVSALNSMSSTGYSVTVTPTGDGIISVSLTGSIVIDAVSNGNTPSNILTRTNDGTDPQVVLTTTASSPTNTGFTVTATFSESVTGVTLSDFTVGSGTASNLTVLSASGYSVLITPNVDGIITVTLPIGAAQDLAGNNSTASATGITLTADITRPTITVNASPTTLISGQTSTVTFTLSENSTTFTGSDVSVSGGVLSAFTGSGTSYTALFTPNTLSSATGTINIGTGAFTDAAGNSNFASALTSLTIDTISPTVTLSTSASGKTNTGFTINATFSESVTGVTLGDFIVTNGVPSDFTILSGSVYSVYVNPIIDGTITIEMTGATAQDVTGNDNTPASSLTRTYDITGPVVALVGSGSQTIPLGSVYSDLGATWTDAIDGTGTLSVASSGTVNTSATGVYILTYTKSDIATNTGNTVTRTVTVADLSGPVTTLSGASTQSLLLNSVYTELGATWSDNVDGTGSIIAPYSGSVNTGSVGTYTLSYRHIDLAGNTGATVTRTVIVSAPAVISGGSSGGGGSSSAPSSSVATTTTTTTTTNPTTIQPVLNTEKKSNIVIIPPSIIVSNDIIARDIKRSKYKNSIETLIQKGVLQNKPNIKPNQSITRAEFVKLLSSFTGFKEVKSTKKFLDVDYTSDLSNYISYAVEAGWINKTNANFRLNDPITVTEAGKLISVVLGNASANTTIKASSNLTRGQAADMIVKNLGIN